jgi:hypothetical protein
MSSAEEKLQWLEEINEFNRIILDDRKKEIRERLRAGKL